MQGIQTNLKVPSVVKVDRASFPSQKQLTQTLNWWELKICTFRKILTAEKKLVAIPRIQYFLSHAYSTNQNTENCISKMS